jgi:biotin carboxyl carrier protein
MYRVKVNNEFQYEIDQQGTELSLEGKTLEIDFSDRENGATHVIYNNKSFNTELVSLNSSEKTCVVKVNGNTYTIQVEDQFDQLLKQLGLDNLAANKVLEIKAPMPGLVLNVMIAVDQEVSKGDNLLILEAMKMENNISAGVAGKVVRVLVEQGKSVDKNSPLVEIELT